MTAADQTTLWAPTRAVNSDVARVLSDPTKSRPIWPPRTPRWILRCFDAGDANVAVTGGIYHINRVREEALDVVVQSSVGGLLDIQTFSHVEGSTTDGAVVETSRALYDVAQTIPLDLIQTVVRINTQIPALFSDKHDQLQWQLNIAAEQIYEVKEELLFNHPTYGLCNNVHPSMEVETSDRPSPDVLDDLLAKMWKRPDCFLMHPDVLAEFHKQATSSGISLEAVELFGASFTTWRGLPILPTNKLQVTPAESDTSEGNTRGAWTTDVLLMRIGLDDNGVVGLYAGGTKSHPDLRFITVEPMGISDNAVAGYLLTTHAAVAVLSPGALARARVTV